jgi:cysteine synthase A
MNARQRRRTLWNDAIALASVDDGAWGRRPDLGDTPVVPVDGVWMVLEGEQAGGSVKARVASWWLDAAIAQGQRPRERGLVVASSGNFGVGLAAAAKAQEVPATIVLSEGTPRAWVDAIEAYGVTLVRVPQVSGTPGHLTGPDVYAAQKHARSLAQRDGALWIDQLTDPACLAAHLAWTGPDLVARLPGTPHAFVAGVGTGATFLGVGEVLRQRFPNMQRTAVEPTLQTTLAGSKAHQHHRMHGCSFGFVPPMWQAARCDALHAVSDGEILDAIERLRDQAIVVGGSGAAAFVVARRLHEASGQPTLAMAADGRRATYLTSDDEPRPA